MDISYLSNKYPNIHIEDGASFHGYCLVDSRVHGLYACFHCILYGLSICEKEGIQPIVRLGKNHLYFDESKGNNVFTYFFDQEQPPLGKHPVMTVLNMGGYLNWCNISTKEKVFSNLLINKFFRLREEMAQLIDSFQRTYFGASRMLGIHYRGTDKVQETPLVSFTVYCRKIELLLEKGSCDKFFFATDELELREYVKMRFKEKAVLYDIEGMLPVAGHNGVGLHFMPGSSSFMNAKNAIIECYLLARCDFLMSSYKSSMSLFPTFINPDIHHIIIEP